LALGGQGWYVGRVTDRAFLKEFFRAVTDMPLEAGAPRYVRLYEGATVLSDDPVELLARAVEFSPGQSVQLLSGFRGTGKTTELMRLESRLIREGYKVVFLSMDRYLNTSTPVDVSDFLMALAGAFGEAMQLPEHLGIDATEEGYWQRFVAFLTKTRIELPEASAQGVKANLKSDPTFRQELQRRMEGHLGALVADVHKFFEDCVKALKARHGDDTEVVVIVDSVEHIRGTFLNARAVQESVETLFAGHAEKLKIPNIHVIYTVPPYLKVRSMNLGMLYGIGAVQVFPAIKVRDDAGVIHTPGIDALKTVLERRGDLRRLIGDEELIKKIILMSGGNIRDLLRLMSEIIRRAKTLPIGNALAEDAINQMRTEFLPIADADAVWLAHIATTHEAALESMDRLPDLTRFFDTHVVLCYRNGPEWYDVHPLIKDIVLKQAKS
jgi:hypothetical protein